MDVVRVDCTHKIICNMTVMAINNKRSLLSGIGWLGFGDEDFLKLVKASFIIGSTFRSCLKLSGI